MSYILDILKKHFGTTTKKIASKITHPLILLKKGDWVIGRDYTSKERDSYHRIFNNDAKSFGPHTAQQVVDVEKTYLIYNPFVYIKVKYGNNGWATADSLRFATEDEKQISINTNREIKS